MCIHGHRRVRERHPTRSIAGAGAPGTRTGYFMGVDLARSIDWTVCVVLNEVGEVVATERFQKPWRETMRRIRYLARGTTRRT